MKRSLLVLNIVVCMMFALSFSANAHFEEYVLEASCDNNVVSYTVRGDAQGPWSYHTLDCIEITVNVLQDGEQIATETQTISDLPDTGSAMINWQVTGSFENMPSGPLTVTSRAIWYHDCIKTEINIHHDIPKEVETGCPFESCRVTAGGNKDGVYCPLLPNKDPDPVYCELDGDAITHTWGGQAGAPPRIDGNWTHKYLDTSVKPHNKFTFHSNNLFDIECSDPGDFCRPARFAPNRQIDFAGIGRFTNKSGIFRDNPDGDLCFMVHLEDTGEPGRGSESPQSENPCTHCPGTEILGPADCTDCTDYYAIEIYSTAANDGRKCTGSLLWRNGEESPNCTGEDIYVAPFAPYEGFFTRAGNVQLHPDNNGP